MHLSDAAPKVYLHYTQEELDRAYHQPAYAPNRDEVVAWYGARSAEVRAALPHRRGVPYGPGPDEVLDVFAPAGASRVPVHLHIHGGRWQVLSRDEESFIAPRFVEAGMACVIPDFSLMPRVRIPDMVGQLRGLVQWLHGNAADFGGDPERIHLSGHSSGAQLASVLLTTDWTKLGLPRDVLKSGLLMSGMYDMRPVVLSARSAYVKLSPEEVLEQSAILHVDRIVAPVSLVYGDRETPEFQRHPQAFAEVLKTAGKEARLTRLDDANHFEVLKQFDDPASALSREALRLMAQP